MGGVRVGLGPCRRIIQFHQRRSLALSHSVTMSVTSKAGAYSLSSCFFLFLWLCVSSCASTKSDRRLPISPPLTMSTMRTPQPTAGLLEAASQGGEIWNKEKLANRTRKHCGKEKKRGKRACQIVGSTPSPWALSWPPLSLIGGTKRKSEDFSY